MPSREQSTPAGSSVRAVARGAARRGSCWPITRATRRQTGYWWISSVGGATRSCIEAMEGDTMDRKETEKRRDRAREVIKGLHPSAREHVLSSLMDGYHAEVEAASLRDDLAALVVTAAVASSEREAFKAEAARLQESRAHAIESLEYLFRASSDHMLSIPSVDWFMERVARALRDLGSMIDLDREPGYRETLLDAGPAPESDPE